MVRYKTPAHRGSPTDDGQLAVLQDEVARLKERYSFWSGSRRTKIECRSRKFFALRDRPLTAPGRNALDG